MLKENIKTLRKSKGLSQEELAIKLNVVRQTISKWEQGLSVPDAEMLIKLAEVLDTTVSTLLGEKVTESKVDYLKAISEKLEVINLQLSQRKNERRKIIFGRNSDFLVELEKLYMNCLYNLDNVYAFNGNTTAFVEIEDGINEYGLSVGLTFVYPTIIKAGFNAGLLVRYLLEKCRTTNEAIQTLKQISIASQQTLTIADNTGNIAVVECNAENVEVIKANEKDNFVIATNEFSSENMKKYNNYNIDDWKAKERFEVGYNALVTNKINFSFDLAKDILSGKYGFMCQYDRKTNADTVWSVIYDIKNKKVYRVEGNPSRKNFKEDSRLKFNYEN